MNKSPLLKFITYSLFLIPLACFAQPGTVTLGIEYKPIFPLSFLRTGTQTATNLDIVYNVKLESGFNGGMVIRKSFTHLLSFETGINYVMRKYDVSIADGNYSESSEFRIIGYEIPILMLIYAQTGEQSYANVSMGISPDMFASNVQTIGDSLRSYTVHPHFIQPAIVANIGWEYRTYESGYFYVGASFHGPFNPDFQSTVSYKQNGIIQDALIPLSGNYLTVDFRFFFPPDSKKKKKTEDDAVE